MGNEEIKFEAWLTELERMIPAGQVLGFENRPINADMQMDRILKYSNLPLGDAYIVEEENSEFYILRQYSGVNDEKGAELYTGDIITNDAAKWLVVFSDGSFCGRIEKSNHEGPFPPIRAIREKVKIGNIYENPELFTK